MGIGNIVGSVASGLLSGAGGGSGRPGRRKAADATKRARNYARDQLNPYAAAGTNALANQPEIYGDFQGGDRFSWDTNALYNDPGYNFVRDEALRGTERQQNAGGNQISGNILTALQDRAGGLASSYSDQFRRNALNESNVNYGRDVGEYGMGVSRNQDMYGRNAGMIDRGMNAATNLGNIRMGAASNLGNIYTKNALANNERNRYMAEGVNNAVQGYMSNDILENYLAQFKPQIGTNTYGGDWNG